MSKQEKGMPSGLNKSEGTGTPQNMEDKNLEKDKKLTEKFTDEGTEISDNVQTNNPNRNVDKTDATNGGSYN